MSPDEKAALEDAQRALDEATRELTRLGVGGASSEALREARDRLSRAEMALRLARGSRRRS